MAQFDFATENGLLEKGYMAYGYTEERYEALEICRRLRDAGFYATCFTHHIPCNQTIIYIKEKKPKEE